MKNRNVVIPIERYEELIGLETRVNVAVEKIIRHNYINIEDLLFILGTELAVEKGMELHEKAAEFDNMPKLPFDLTLKEV